MQNRHQAFRLIEKYLVNDWESFLKRRRSKFPRESSLTVRSSSRVKRLWLFCLKTFPDFIFFRFFFFVEFSPFLGKSTIIDLIWHKTGLALKSRAMTQKRLKFNCEIEFDFTLLLAGDPGSFIFLKKRCTSDLFTNWRDLINFVTSISIPLFYTWDRRVLSNV
jgi:hypothetical protein